MTVRSECYNEEEEEKEEGEELATSILICG